MQSWVTEFRQGRSCSAVLSRELLQDVAMSAASTRCHLHSTKAEHT